MISSDEITRLLPLAFEKCHLPLDGRFSGKVRDWYLLGQNHRLLITTDRLSAFDRVISCVPYKGQVLNELSIWWFKNTNDIIPSHYIGSPDPNAMVVHEVIPYPIEVIVRGYITGVTKTALWYRYSIGERDIYGYTFPDGLHKNEPLPTPIITPTTKGGPSGHDERLTCTEVVTNGYVPQVDWDQIMAAALELFKRGQQTALKADMILVDTKYEFGRTKDGRIILIDEIHTPDSSRFWKNETYLRRLRNSQEPENFDKEVVRIGFVEKGYQGFGNPPTMPNSFWAMTSALYVQAYEALTGTEFRPAKYPIEPRLIENLEIAGIIK